MQDAREQTMRLKFTGQPGTAPGRYQILFINEGQANGFTFSRQVLQESAELWEGASVFVDHSFWGQSVKDLGGVLSAAAWSAEHAGLTADLTPVGPSREIIAECAAVMLQDGPHPDIGFSADVIFSADAQGNVKRILKPMSVDLVMDTAFATKFIRQLNSRKEPMQEPKPPTPATPPPPVAAGPERDPIAEYGRLLLANTLTLSGLPAKAQEAIRTSFANRPIVLEEVQTAVQAWKDSLAEQTAAAEIAGPGRIHSMFSADDQIAAAIDDLVGAPRDAGSENLKVHKFTGLKEAYMTMTGDRDMVGGFFKDRIQFQHTTDTFPGLVKNALNKALIREWGQLGRAGYDWWQKVVRVEHFESVNSITWLLFGTVASLPTVAEGAEYTELKIGDSPETSSFVKKGGYIGLTLEAIDRDDGRRLRQIPRELAYAGLREISALVAAVFTDNSKVGPTLADTGALFNNTAVTTKGGHANLLAAAIGTTFEKWDLAAAAMYNQPMLTAMETGHYGAGKKMAIEPKYCLVPRTLKAAAEALFIPRWAGTVESAIAATGGPTYGGFVEPIVVPEWTNASDWAAVADPQVMPGIMVAERFGLVPQIFLAGSESDPAMFANDEQRIKVRHFIAVGVADFRPLHKSNI